MIKKVFTFLIFKKFIVQQNPKNLPPNSMHANQLTQTSHFDLNL